ncbi:MAG TPA: hypothetical protein VJH97_05640 [Candidatus Nanoarchaeia archaeon]|nr:hypothetical protein [Candidatus Nanoarchaeia archaeon]
MMQQDPGAEEIVLHDMGGHNYFCYTCQCTMKNLRSNFFKCPECGLEYKES